MARTQAWPRRRQFRGAHRSRRGGEAYELEILSGPAVLRTLSATSPSTLYATSDETLDFGSAQSSFSVRLYQIVGRRRPRPARHRHSHPLRGPMSTSANLALPFIEGGELLPDVTLNETLRLIDTLVQLAIVDRDLNVPPGSPAEGQRWIVKASPSPTGAWAGHGNHIAAWQDGGWVFCTPQGRMARLRDRRGCAGRMERQRVGRRARDAGDAAESRAARRRHHRGRDQSVQRQAQQCAVGGEDRRGRRRRASALQDEQGECREDALAADPGQFLRPRRDRPYRRRRPSFQGVGRRIELARCDHDRPDDRPS